MKDVHSSEEMIKNLEKDGAFECEHSRKSVYDYFNGQVDAIESINNNLLQLLELINKTKTMFISVMQHTKNIDSNCEHEVH